MLHAKRRKISSSNLYKKVYNRSDKQCRQKQPNVAAVSVSRRLDIAPKSDKRLREAFWHNELQEFCDLLHANEWSETDIKDLFYASLVSDQPQNMQFFCHLVENANSVHLDLTEESCKALDHTILTKKSEKFSILLEAACQSEYHRREIIRHDLVFHLFVHMHFAFNAQLWSSYDTYRAMAKLALHKQLYEPHNLFVARHGLLFGMPYKQQQFALSIAIRSRHKQFYSLFVQHFLDALRCKKPRSVLADCYRDLVDALCLLAEREWHSEARQLLDALPLNGLCAGSRKFFLAAVGLHPDHFRAVLDKFVGMDTQLLTEALFSASQQHHRLGQKTDENFALLLSLAPQNVLMQQNCRILRSLVEKKQYSKMKIIEQLRMPCFVHSTFGYKSDFLKHYMLVRLSILFYGVLPPYVIDSIAEQHGFLSQYTHRERIGTILSVHRAISFAQNNKK